jgi:hypothetical protein
VIWVLLGLIEGRLREEIMRATPLAVGLHVSSGREAGSERLYVKITTTAKNALDRIERAVEAQLAALRDHGVDAVELRAQRLHTKWLALMGAEHTLDRARALVLERSRRGPVPSACPATTSTSCVASRTPAMRSPATCPCRSRAPA